MTNKLQRAMAAAEEPDSVSQQASGTDIATQGEQAVERGLTDKLPAFTTHSSSLAKRMAADGEAIIAQVAEVDAKIALLRAERDDLLLSYSMLSHGLTAKETGRRT